jgi:phytoene synthase
MYDVFQNKNFNEILTNPILDIAARFWDEERYEAFRICYRTMRWIDNLVDDRKASSVPVQKKDIEQIKKNMQGWMRAIKDRDISDSFTESFIVALDTYKIPFWPWERLYRAMLYDLEHDGFKNIAAFLRYSEGAAVAPASVFMHLCGITKKGDEYIAPEYDIRLSARALALFSYIVHVIRDFQTDQLKGLNYFADDLLDDFDITGNDLKKMAKSGTVTESFREMMVIYMSIADFYRRKALISIKQTKLHLGEEYQLSVELIYQLYFQIYKKIDIRSSNFTSAELNPTVDEMRDKVKETVAKFNQRNL